MPDGENWLIFGQIRRILYLVESAVGSEVEYIVGRRVVQGAYP